MVDGTLIQSVRDLLIVASKRVLLTGSTGFVGGAIARRLIAGPGELHLICRGNRTGPPPIGGGATLHEGDLTDRSWVAGVIREVRPEVIIHCASHGGFHFQRDRTQMIASNIHATSNLLEAAEHAPIQSFIHSGSSSEYGASDIPMHEGMPLLPTTVYGATKAAATLLCCAAAKTSGLPVTVLRLFSPYGPGEARSRLVSSVALDCLRNESPKVSSGTQARDFVFIEDVVDAYAAAIDAPSVGKVINIGSGRQSLVRDVVSRIVELVGNNVQPQWGAEDGRVFDSPRWEADIGKAEQLLEWVPRTDLDDGLLRTIRYLQEELVTEKGPLGEHKH